MQVLQSSVLESDAWLTGDNPEKLPWDLKKVKCRNSARDIIERQEYCAGLAGLL